MHAVHALCDDTRVSLIKHLSEEEELKIEPTVQLVHKHLPMLEDHNIIRWDRENHFIERGTKFEEVLPLIEKL